MSTRRLEPKELQRAFARGPRQDLEFLIPARGPTGAAAGAPPEGATAAPEVATGPLPAPTKPRRTTRRKRAEDTAEPAARRGRTRRTKKAIETPVIETPVIETPVIETSAIETSAIETPAVEAPVSEAPASEAPVSEAPVSAIAADTLAPMIDTANTDTWAPPTITLRTDADQPWAPATAPWPRPTLLDHALRRLERFVGRLLRAA